MIRACIRIFNGATGWPGVAHELERRDHIVNGASAGKSLVTCGHASVAMAHKFALTPIVAGDAPGPLTIPGDRSVGWRQAHPERNLAPLSEGTSGAIASPARPATRPTG